MADFKTRIDDLTGFGSTDDVAIVDWLTAGAREIIDVLPMSKLDRMSEIQAFTGNVNVEDSKILHVLRKDENNSDVLMPCREIHASQSGRASDSNYMEFATSSDPAYYLENKRIYTLPASASSNDSKLVKINEDFTIAATDSAISNFAKEATNAVVLYASRNALMRLMNAKHSNTSIATGFTALKTELDETQAISDEMNTQIDEAIGEIAEMITNIDDNIDTALTAMKTSADKINAAIELANIEFDAAEVDNNNEDTELANSKINGGNAFLSEAQGRANEVATYAAEVTSRLSQVNVQGSVVSNKLAAAQGFASEIATKINISQAYGNEISLRLAVDSKEYDWYTTQYQMVNAQFQQALQLIGIDKIKIEQMMDGK